MATYTRKLCITQVNETLGIDAVHQCDTKFTTWEVYTQTATGWTFVSTMSTPGYLSREQAADWMRKEYDNKFGN